MPTTYTHYRFGIDVYKQLPVGIRRDIRPFLDLFCIGLHGPDLLFYYRALYPNPVNRLGFAMHKRPGMEFFSEAARTLERMEDEDVAPARAYLYGFLCHFALDSSCHPLVEQSVRRTGISHSEIEAELDRWYMIKDGVDPMHCHPTRHFRASTRNARVISHFFPGVGLKEARTAIRSIRFYVNILTIYTAAGHALLRDAMRLIHCPRALRDMVMRPQPNPACVPICRRLMKRYKLAVANAVELILNFQGHIEKGEPLSLRLNHTFGEF